MSTYNRVIRKLVVGFGNLFDNITLYRFKSDLTESERFVVPIAYASKERYVMRLEEDLNLDKKVQLTLPRMSFEMAGLSYDSSRKQNTNIKNFSGTPPSGILSQYNPVPYNFNFNLYIYVRNIEDGTQIIEHILPFFTPDYTIKLNLIPEMGIIKEIPVILNSTSHEITYEGGRDNETRMIIWTLNFTVKGFIFGKVTETSVINRAFVSVYNLVSQEETIEFYMNLDSGYGTYKVGEKVYQGYTPEDATATGMVVQFTDNVLRLKELTGNFVSDKPIYGINTLANYNFTSYNLNPLKFVEVDSVGRVSTDIDYMSVDKEDAKADNTLAEVTTINKAANQ
jgi:pSer/pThr/pTyr-binding forkhead associated (FHA) protein